MRRSLRVVLPVVAALAVAAGCAKARARTEPESPVPESPVATLLAATTLCDTVAAPALPEPEPIALRLAAEARERPAPATRPAPGPEPARAEPPPPPEPPVPPPPVLSTPETADQQEMVRVIRGHVVRARQLLAAVQYGRLSPDGKAQYDTVGQLITQAEDALKTGNLVFAFKVADKAETLARQLK